MPYYAVRHGHEPGIYVSWEQCEKQVKGFSKAVYKKFETKFDAIAFIITKSPCKNSAISTEKESLATDKQDLSKKSVDQANLAHKRKLDDKYQKNENTHTVSSNESKETRVQNEQPVDKKSKKNLDSVDKQPNDKTQKSMNHQKNFQTEYEDKKHEFSFKGQKAIVYTDGACSNNGKQNALAGIGVFWGTNHPLNISKRLNGPQTNNRAEINAAIVSISQALTYNASELTIYTDSKFMMNSITDWIKKWKSNGWKTSNGEPVKNIEDFKRLDDLCSRIKVNWEYVPGHSGHHGNEEADKLATQCLK